MKNVFNKTHIGQKVSSPMQGNGVIIKFKTSKLFPVIVEKIENGEINVFSACGRPYISDVHPSLVFGHREASSYNCGTPELVLEALVIKDRPILAYVSYVSLEDALEMKQEKLVLGRKADLFGDIWYFTVGTGSDLNNLTTINNYKYAIAIPSGEKNNNSIETSSLPK